MSEHNGYIALHRKLLDNPVVCKDADHLAIWVWLLLKASWKESDVLFNGERITLKPGDLPPISRRTIAKDLGISDSKVQRVLKFFEIEHQIEQRTNHQSRLISIVSWDKYQGSEPPVEPQVNHDRTTSEPRVNTIEESNKGNKGNKGKKDIYSDLPQPLKDALKDFEQMRVRIKHPMTDRARATLLGKLNKLAGDNTELKIKILEQSIFHSWQGVFPLNEAEYRATQQPMNEYEREEQDILDGIL